ncbi:MAG: type II/IV secretion system ATPase subunit [Nanoarchaeota archaeon]
MEKKDITSFKRVEINFNPQKPNLNLSKNKTQLDIRYCLIYPFAFAHIYWDEKEYEIKYDIEEPILNEEEENYKEEIITTMKNIIDFDFSVKNPKEILDYIDKRFKIIASELGIKMTYDSYKKIYYYLCRDFEGFNEIDPLLRDYYVEDIECNGVGTPVYVVHRVLRSIKTNLVFDDFDKLSSFVEKLAQRCNKYVSHANPVLDGSLPDGSRVNATYTKEISSKGPTFTIRKFTKTPWTPTRLLSMDTLSPEMLAYLWILIQYKMNILIAGGTSSGKTTLLNAMAFFIRPEDRVVSIEDTAELNLPRENWLPSVVRDTMGEVKSSNIDLFRLLKNSFRQNPDYVVVGEVRGKETFVLFQGMSSGHASISTMHADSVKTLVKRLETPPINLPPTLLNVLNCVCIMTFAIVKKDETRKLKEIVEIIDIDDKGNPKTNTPFVWKPEDDSFYFKTESKVFEEISKRHGISLNEIHEEFEKRTRLLYTLQKKNIFEFETMQDIVNEYYKRPEEVLKRYGIR